MEHQQHAARARQRAEVSHPMPAARCPLPCWERLLVRPWPMQQQMSCCADEVDSGSRTPPQVGTITTQARSPASASILTQSLSPRAPLMPHRYLPGVDGELITGVMVPWLYVGSCLSGEACILLLASFLNKPGCSLACVCRVL